MRRAGILVLCLSSLTSACGGGNVLTGSIGESYNLDFDLVRIRGQDQDVLVEFVKLVSGGENKALKIVVEGRKLIAADGSLITLGNGLVIDGELFSRAVTLDRVVSSGAGFPEVEAGRVFFSTLQRVAGGRVDGTFDVVFENGRTMSGGFAGQLELVDLS